MKAHIKTIQRHGVDIDVTTIRSVETGSGRHSEGVSMTHKEIAERLRTLFGQGDENMSLTQMEKSMIEARQLADELDPPRPEPGTVVWWRVAADDKWHLGCVVGYGIVPADNLGACWNWDYKSLEYKPARILADDEVAVEKNELANLRYFVNNPSAWDDGFSQNVSDAIERLITRAEAERMEAGGE